MVEDNLLPIELTPTKDVVDSPTSTFNIIKNVGLHVLTGSEICDSREELTNNSPNILYTLFSRLTEINANFNPGTVEHYLLTEVFTQVLTDQYNYTHPNQPLNLMDGRLGALLHDIGRVFSHWAGRNNHIGDRLVMLWQVRPEITSSTPQYEDLMPPQFPGLLRLIRGPIQESRDGNPDSMEQIRQVINLVQDSDKESNVQSKQLAELLKINPQLIPLADLAREVAKFITNISAFKEHPAKAIAQYADLAGKLEQEPGQTNSRHFRNLSVYQDANFHQQYQKLPNIDIQKIWPSAFNWQIISVLFATSFAKRDSQIIQWVTDELGTSTGDIETKALTNLSNKGLAIKNQSVEANPEQLVKILSNGIVEF
jgi:hypothetical protein